MEISRWRQRPDSVNERHRLSRGGGTREFPAPLPGRTSLFCVIRWLTPPANFCSPSRRERFGRSSTGTRSARSLRGQPSRSTVGCHTAVFFPAVMSERRDTHEQRRDDEASNARRTAKISRAPRAPKTGIPRGAEGPRGRSAARWTAIRHYFGTTSPPSVKRCTLKFASSNRPPPAGASTFLIWSRSALAKVSLKPTKPVCGFRMRL